MKKWCSTWILSDSVYARLPPRQPGVSREPTIRSLLLVSCCIWSEEFARAAARVAACLGLVHLRNLILARRRKGQAEGSSPSSYDASVLLADERLDRKVRESSVEAESVQSDQLTESDIEHDHWDLSFDDRSVGDFSLQ